MITSSCFMACTQTNWGSFYYFNVNNKTKWFICQQCIYSSINIFIAIKEVTFSEQNINMSKIFNACRNITEFFDTIESGQIN